MIQNVTELSIQFCQFDYFIQMKKVSFFRFHCILFNIFRLLYHSNCFQSCPKKRIIITLYSVIVSKQQGSECDTESLGVWSISELDVWPWDSVAFWRGCRRKKLNAPVKLFCDCYTCFPYIALYGTRIHFQKEITYIYTCISTYTCIMLVLFCDICNALRAHS